ncbi:MAG: prolipoprotein diacylglyceryl transferase [Prevotella sp.]|nr:prolipoprotein diacylglyceryl transferase [Prevotella sp.]
MNYELFIHWNPDPEIVSFGGFALRWYSMCWLVGLALAYLYVRYLFYSQGIAVRKVKGTGRTPDREIDVFEPLFIYCFLGILIGARLGHCLFYEPDYFLSSGKHIVEMLLPIRFLADGGWRFTGYEGLASHGGTLGLMIALWLYVRWSKLSLWTVLDNIAIATPVTACLIRIANLMNSEIIGKVTDVPWAFIFERVDQFPRHPGQLYEAIAYACFIPVMWFVYKKSRSKENMQKIANGERHIKTVGSGYYFGLVLTLIFTFRFFIEYTKDIQVNFEQGMLFNMGQLLSVPFIVLGIACMKGGRWMRKLGKVEE